MVHPTRVKKILQIFVWWEWGGGGRSQTCPHHTNVCKIFFDHFEEVYVSSLVFNKKHSNLAILLILRCSQCSTQTFLETRQWARKWNKSLAQEGKPLVQKNTRGVRNQSSLFRFLHSFHFVSQSYDTSTICIACKAGILQSFRKAILSTCLTGLGASRSIFLLAQPKVSLVLG